MSYSGIMFAVRKMLLALRKKSVLRMTMMVFTLLLVLTIIRQASLMNLGSNGGFGMSSGNDDNTELKREFGKFLQLVLDTEPAGVAELSRYSPTCRLTRDVGYWNEGDRETWDLSAYAALSDCLQVSAEEEAALRDAHARFVAGMEAMASDSGSLMREHYQGSGIVVVGGSKFSVLAFEMIKVLRSHGTTLPVEVFIPPGEPDLAFCAYISENLDARCIYLEEVFPHEVVANYAFKGYQYKALAMMVSSFKELLLLDADNLPLVDIQNIFDAEIFQKTGMILWPDCWRRTTSPYYYAIVGKLVDFGRRVRNFIDDLTPVGVYTEPGSASLSESDFGGSVPMHDFANSLPDVSTESGQLMIDKSRHLKSLLLSFYYNVHGPKYYYPLFSQGRAGEGDKETFVAAAHFWNAPYYQVRAGTGMDGYHGSDGSGYHAVAMYQHDFQADYEMYLAAEGAVAAQYGAVNSYARTFEPGSERSAAGEPAGNAGVEYDPLYSPIAFHHDHYSGAKKVGMFVHCNILKFDPVKMYRDRYGEDSAGEFYRYYTNREELRGFDLEATMLSVVLDHVCVQKDSKNNEKKHIEFAHINSKLPTKKEQEEMCAYFSKRHQYLLANPLSDDS